MQPLWSWQVFNVNWTKIHKETLEQLLENRGYYNFKGKCKKDLTKILTENYHSHDMNTLENMDISHLQAEMIGRNEKYSYNPSKYGIICQIQKVKYPSSYKICK